MLGAIKCIIDDNFVIQFDSAPLHLAVVHSATAAVQNSQLPFSYGPVTVQSVTPLTTRFRESYSSKTDTHLTACFPGHPG